MYNRQAIRSLSILAGAVLVLGMQGVAWAEKPLLSEELRALVSANDLETASNKMMEIYSSLGDYENDEAGVVALVHEYLAAGNDKAAQAVAEFELLATGAMSAPALAAAGDVQRAQGQVGGASALYTQALRMDSGYEYAQEALEALERGEAPTAPKHAESARSESIELRDDLARFKGRYEKAGDAGRVVAISETCYRSGILRAVPEWADVTPLDFNSISDLVFEQADAPSGAKAVRLEFEQDPGSAGEAFVASGGLEGRFVWSSYLPDGWEPEDCR